jgi:hypothetical protein
MPKNGRQGPTARLVHRQSANAARGKPRSGLEAEAVARRRRAEQARRQSEDRYRVIVETTRGSTPPT